ncbi:hypothetical protein J6590_056326 [Homalodisca vitripennis]|nr:hypothetical protein J6590_056326 [Homalodisca vitripennis]
MIVPKSKHVYRLSKSRSTGTAPRQGPAPGPLAHLLSVLFMIPFQSNYCYLTRTTTYPLMYRWSWGVHLPTSPAHAVKRSAVGAAVLDGRGRSTVTPRPGVLASALRSFQMGS